MIINKAHNFGFVHIPKCAGSTVRQQLRDQDDLGGRFYHTIKVPGFAKINGNHTQLKVLKTHFPGAFAALQEVTSYAITRDPLDRFISSVSQYLRSAGKDPGAMRKTEILAEVHRLMAALSAPSDQHVIAHTIFFRQTDYVFCDGERIIDHLYPIERLDRFFDRLATQHDLHLIRDKKWNPTVTYRVPAMRGRIEACKKVAQKYLPMKAYVALRDWSARMLTTEGATELEQVFRESLDVCTFVAEHYAQDARLHRAAQADHP